jgi:hypothetical protein
LIVSAELPALRSDGDEVLGDAGGVGGAGFAVDAERLAGLHATNVKKRLRSNPWIIPCFLRSNFTRCAETMKVVYHLPQKLSI